MLGALIILAVTLVTGLVLYLTHKPDSVGVASQPDEERAGEECCGLHAVCEKTIGQIDAPAYFDDEELDRYAARDPETYTPDEVEEFREVLYTLLPQDVYAWGASLTLRNIALPTSLRDEWIMLCSK